ncbi:winged helix-turn-helix transcriptional regulator [Kitasatospora albolonga]|uniref:winged helix-turn-helix transcriptional regulator n=1 Tax=Kitasatospora albolonga TaxID=68173 RepID=UPI0031F0F889
MTSSRRRSVQGGAPGEVVASPARDGAGELGPARPHPEQLDGGGPEEAEGCGGLLVVRRRERFDARALRFQRHGGTLTLALRKEKRTREADGTDTPPGPTGPRLADGPARSWRCSTSWVGAGCCGSCGSCGTTRRRRFRQLQQRCDGISSSVLAVRLRELGQADLVEHAGEGYLLTGQGRSLLERLARLDAWAADWRPRAEG